MPEEYFGVHVPEDAYGFSKYVMAKYIEQADKITNLRLFGVFGKYEDYEFKFISNAIVKNLLGMPIVINQNVNFDYLYVDDLIRMVAAFIGRRSQYRAYNAVSGRTIDLITIAQKINHLSDQSSEIVVRNPGMNVEYSADNQRIVHELGGFEYTDYDAAIASLYAWYKQKLPEIDRVGIEKDASFKYCRTKGESK
jgi:GDP-L-fucose synthase